MLFRAKTSREHGVAPTGVHCSMKRFTPTRSGVWGCSRVRTSIELPQWPPTRAPWFDGVLLPARDAFDCKDRGENSRSRGRMESLSGNTGSNPVRGTTSVPLRPPPGHRCAAAELSTGQTVMAGLWFLSERVAGPLALRGLGEWSAQTG